MQPGGRGRGEGARCQARYKLCQICIVTGRQTAENKYHENQVHLIDILIPLHLKAIKSIEIFNTVVMNKLYIEHL